MLKQINRENKMANIFQQLHYTPFECEILDFIKENKKSIEYDKQAELSENGYPVGTKHIVRIWNDTRRLEACLTKYPNSNSSTRYFFTCNDVDKNKTFCKLCPLYDINYKYGKFAYKVYTKMLKHYIRQHGCPVCR